MRPNPRTRPTQPQQVHARQAELFICDQTIGRLFSKPKWFSRAATCYDRLAANSAGVARLAATTIPLR